MDEAELAICGVSARIAKCKNLEEFTRALLNGEDLVTSEHNRWNYEFLKTPKAIGILDDLENFDAKFFGISPKQADQLDPRTRQLLEVVFESIVDAGYNPQDLRGTNTAVILAVAENSNEGLMDRSLAIMANTISYYLDLKGPSYALDTGCSSSVYALNQAVEALSFGSCENAVVCSAQTHLLPSDSVQLNKLGVLSKEGKCQAFDDDRDGYVKSEGIISIFVQKQNKARRIYATIAGIGCNVDGFKNEGMFNPSSQSQFNLLRRIYEKFELDPNDVEYIDAHGTGTLIGDIKECNALADFFATKGRSSPIKIGSAKTNAGHCENAAGLVSLLKLIIVINSGIIPGNIHFKTAALDIPSIDNKKLEVVQNNTQYNGGLLSLNSFGIGGANAHVVIRPYRKNKFIPIDVEKPRLIFVSGRTQESVIKLLDKIEENKGDLAFLTLLDNIFKTPIKNHHYKGFMLSNKNERLIQKCTDTRIPIWFSYSGMGSQWKGMARHLMCLNVFRDTMETCANVLKPFGIDLMETVLNGDDLTFNDPEKCFPAIIAVSVGLTDILYSLGIKPDGIIGHSLGEIGCAYGDGLITQEQAILIAHARGLATKETTLIPGLMASVGLTIEECEKILPDDIYIACHNSDQNVTVSGPKTSIKLFVKHLTDKGIFTRIVNTAGVAFHSKYIHDAGPLLLKKLTKVIPEPRKRCRWIPSALPQHGYDSYLGKFNSAEYHCHNFMNKVLYKQVLDNVPEGSILIEIAPGGLFQAIFKRALSKSILKLYLGRKDVDNNMELFLSTIAKIYLSTNIPINLKALNESSPLPLNGKTPFMSPLIQWDHSSKWNVSKYVHNSYRGEKIIINLMTNDFKFLRGHVVNGKPIFPSTGVLVLAWQAFANKNETEMNQCSVTLRNVKILKSVILKDVLEFHVNILESGDFEIIETGSVVTKGRISWLDEFLNQNLDVVNDNGERIESSDVYKEFHLRGYEYSTDFQRIQHINVSGTSGTIKWHKTWISFMESIIQSITFYEYSNLVTPTNLLQVNIDPGTHQELLKQEKDFLSYHYDHLTRIASCGGVQIQGLTSQRIKQRHEIQVPILNRYEFIPNEFTYRNEHKSHLEFSLSIALQIVMENNTNSLKTCVAGLGDEENNFKETIFELIHRRYLKNVKFSLFTRLDEVESNVDLIICSLDQDLSYMDVFKVLEHKAFVFCKIKDPTVKKLGDNVVFRCSHEDVSYVLLRKVGKISKKFEVVKTSNDNFGWVEKVKENLNINDCKTYLVSATLTTGLIGFFNCLREESQAANIRIFILNNSTTKDFDPNAIFYKSQVRKDLVINIFQNDEWCTYRMLPLICNANKKIENYCLKIKEDELQWVESNFNRADKLAVVKYACMSIWDRLNYQQQNQERAFRDMSMEFSGISNSGKHIMGISEKGCLRTMTDSNMYWVIPEDSNLSFEESATLPLDYIIANYALHIKGKIHSLDNILISGSDPTCLAATFFALKQGCKVFMEIHNPNAVSMVENYFRGNSRQHLVLLHKNDLLKKIMTQTDNKGITVLFFSREENINLCHTEILANNSKLISIYQNNTEIDSYIMNEFSLKECQIYRTPLNKILTQDAAVLNIIKSSIQKYLNENALKPFEYASEEISDSPSKILEFLSRDSEDKLVLSVNKSEVNSKNIKRKIFFDCNKTYVVVGGLGGVGLELTKWLIKKGATKIILNSRNSIVSEYAKFLMKKWHFDGKTVLTNNHDARTVGGARTILEEAVNLAPVGGIFNLAMVLNDKLFSELSSEDFVEVVAPKLYISQNLGQLSETICPDLEYFVIFSAMTALGNQGQSNYGFANSSVEMLCKQRKSKGMSALAVQWGCIGDVGYVSRQNLKRNFLKENPQSIHSCLETLEDLLLKDFEVVSSAVYETSGDANGEGGACSKDTILNHIALVLGAKYESDLDKNTPLVNFGMDSISSLEIRNLIRDECGIEKTSSEIRKMTLEHIDRLINELKS